MRSLSVPPRNLSKVEEHMPHYPSVDLSSSYQLLESSSITDTSQEEQTTPPTPTKKKSISSNDNNDIIELSPSDKQKKHLNRSIDSSLPHLLSSNDIETSPSNKQKKHLNRSIDSSLPHLLPSNDKTHFTDGCLNNSRPPINPTKENKNKNKNKKQAAFSAKRKKKRSNVLCAMDDDDDLELQTTLSWEEEQREARKKIKERRRPRKNNKITRESDDDEEEAEKERDKDDDNTHPKSRSGSRRSRNNTGSSKNKVIIRGSSLTREHRKENEEYLVPPPPSSMGVNPRRRTNSPPSSWDAKSSSPCVTPIRGSSSSPNSSPRKNSQTTATTGTPTKANTTTTTPVTTHTTQNDLLSDLKVFERNRNLQIQMDIISSSGKATSFIIPAYLIIQREREMISIAQELQVQKHQWNGSLLARKLQEFKIQREMYETSRQIAQLRVQDKEDDYGSASAATRRFMMCESFTQCGDMTNHLDDSFSLDDKNKAHTISFLLDPESDVCLNNNNHSQSRSHSSNSTMPNWNKALTHSISYYYRTNSIPISNSSPGNDVLLALEYFGIVYLPTQLEFESFGCYLRVKLWSDYYTHRATMANWVRRRLIVGRSRHLHLFVTGMEEEKEEGFRVAGKKRWIKGDLLEGGIKLENRADLEDEKRGRLSSYAVVYDFFNDDDDDDEEDENATDNPISSSDESSGHGSGNNPLSHHHSSIVSLLRQDFSSYLEASLPGTEVTFVPRDVSIGSCDGKKEDAKTVSRAVLHIDFHSAVKRDKLQTRFRDVGADAGTTTVVMIDTDSKNSEENNNSDAGSLIQMMQDEVEVTSFACLDSAKKAAAMATAAEECIGDVPPSHVRVNDLNNDQQTVTSGLTTAHEEDDDGDEDELISPDPSCSAAIITTPKSKKKKDTVDKETPATETTVSMDDESEDDIIITRADQMTPEKQKSNTPHPTPDTVSSDGQSSQDQMERTTLEGVEETKKKETGKENDVVKRSIPLKDPRDSPISNIEVNGSKDALRGAGCRAVSNDTKNAFLHSISKTFVDLFNDIDMNKNTTSTQSKRSADDGGDTESIMANTTEAKNNDETGSSNNNSITREMPLVDGSDVVPVLGASSTAATTAENCRKDTLINDASGIPSQINSNGHVTDETDAVSVVTALSRDIHDAITLDDMNAAWLRRSLDPDTVCSAVPGALGVIDCCGGECSEGNKDSGIAADSSSDNNSEKKSGTKDTADTETSRSEHEKKSVVSWHTTRRKRKEEEDLMGSYDF